MHRSPHCRYRSQSIYLAALLALVLTTTTGLIVAPSRVFAAGFGSGNLVVLRIGDGSASLSSAATAVFLDEFTPVGSLAQTIALPTATSGSNARLTNSGSATSEGALSRSADGRYLTLAGYDADLGTSSIASTASASVNRVIARVEATGVVDTRTRISDGYTGNNIRGVVTNDGTGFWTGGTASGTAGGVRYVPFGNTGTSTQITNPPTNVRVPNIFNGQLYVSSGSSPYVGVSQVGTGLPTSSLQTTSLLSGLPNSGNPYAYVLLDRDGTVSGVDTLYIADQTSSIGLAKYSFDGTTWTARGTSAGVLTGLTGVVNGGSVTLYATLGTGAGNTLVSFTDSAAYNATMSSGSFTTLATAAANTVFRGVAFAPESGSETPTAPSITTQPADQSITTGNTAILTVTVSGSAPLSYQWYQGSAGDTSTPVGSNSASFTTPTLTATTSYWVRVTNSAGSVDSAMATVTVTAAPATCSAADTPIYTVQGSSDTSPLSGKTVTVQGAVVGDYEGASPNLRGFFLQDLNLDTDDSTSEGIFVFESNNADSVSLGQVVQVTGTVAEYQGQTEIDSPTVEDCGETASVPPTDVTLPFASANDLERFEGMLVRFPQTLYVTEHYQLGRFGQVVLSSSARLAQPTNIVAPGTAATTQQAANDLNRIIVDDAQNSQNPEQILFGRGGNSLSADNTLRGGDSASNIVGVLTYTWSGNSASGNAYRLRPINALGGGAPNFQPTNSRPSDPPTVGGNLKVASFNVLNYFLSLDSSSEALCGPLGAKQECRGAETAQELSRQQQKLNQALIKLDADVLGLIELENTQDAQGQDVNPLADIVARLNGSLGSDVYRYINTGVIGSDTIRVGIIYKKASVTPVGDPLIDTSSIHNRPPVAQLFTENVSGEHFTVIVDHFKSKSSCPSDTTDLDSDQGDGQGCWNQTRVQQAQALITFINNTVVPTTTDPDVLLIGDFNSYAKENPITTLANAGFTNLLLRYNGSDAYSYAYDGQWGYLDQGLASASLLPQVTGASDYHINADEPSVIDYNTNYKSASQLTSLFNADEFRTSDHDPVVIGVNLQPLIQANDDRYDVEAGTTLTVSADQGLLANDTGSAAAIISYTSPSHGTLILDADGGFTYAHQAGNIGADSFTYTVDNTAAANAVQIYRTNVASLGTFGGVNVTGGGYGSSLAAVPGSNDEFYGLTDRGPNVDGPNGSKIEPIPSFTPTIGKFTFSNGQAILKQTIPLQAADGTPYNGQVSTQADTGEIIYDLDGNTLPASPYGYDPEGLVALADGSFWVSDEYGPFITHFDASGKQIERLSPFDGSLPTELAKRIANRGMEGLTITPDGSTLVGIMQSALQQTDLDSYDAKKLTPLRIVTYKLATGETHAYLYLLDNPQTTKTSVSEISALSNTTFLVDERDGNYLPGAYKKIWKIDISSATDVGPQSSVADASYDPANGGLLVDSKSLELLVKGQNTAAATTTLTSKGIIPATKSLYLDLGALLTKMDAQGYFFPHDKIEGLAVANDGKRLIISNDSDFGIDGISNSSAPFQLHAKTNTAGVQDDGEYLVIDLANATATVTITAHDTRAPDTAIDTNPTNPSNSATASFSFHGSDSGTGLASFACQLDSGDWATCTSGVSYANLVDGSHSFQVRAIDSAGNSDDTPASYSWMIDTSAPTTTISSGPASRINSGNAEFVFSATDSGTGVASYACARDNTDFSSCTSPVSYTDLARGKHTFQVRAIDKAGNIGTAASYTWTINAAATTTRFTTSANPAVTGQTITYTARVNVVSPGTGTPDGNVSFLAGKTVLCRDVALVNGVATCSTTFSRAGSHLIIVAYNGSTYFLPSKAIPGIQFVKYASQTTLTSSLTPSVYGQKVTFTAVVNTGEETRLSGSVTFFDGKTVLGTRELSRGKASLSTSALDAGSHTITAVYNGTSDIVRSVSPEWVQQVSQANTSTTIKASANPVVPKQNVTLSASVSMLAPGSGKPDGSVSFLDGEAVLGTIRLSDGKAALTVRLESGSHSISAVYNGNANVSVSTSPVISIVVGKVATQTTLASSANPAASGKKIIFSASVATATPSLNILAGRVTFYDGKTLLGTASLTDGKATFATTSLSRGTHTITAVYNGDASYLASTSNTFSQQVR